MGKMFVSNSWICFCGWRKKKNSPKTPSFSIMKTSGHFYYAVCKIYRFGQAREIRITCSLSRPRRHYQFLFFFKGTLNTDLAQRRPRWTRADLRLNVASWAGRRLQSAPEGVSVPAGTDLMERTLWTLCVFSRHQEML